MLSVFKSVARALKTLVYVLAGHFNNQDPSIASSRLFMIHARYIFMS